MEKKLNLFLVNAHCQTGKFELRVQSSKLSVYKVGVVIEALACRHRTISRCLLVKLAYKSICVHDQITILDWYWIFYWMHRSAITCSLFKLDLSHVMSYDEITKGKLNSNIRQTGTLQRPRICVLFLSL